MSEPLILIAAVLVACLIAVVILSNQMLPPPGIVPNKLSRQLQMYAAETSFRDDNPDADEELLYAAILDAWGSDYSSAREIRQFRAGEMMRLRMRLDESYLKLATPTGNWAPARKAKSTRVPAPRRPEPSETVWG
jgi:hypothetical protein